VRSGSPAMRADVALPSGSRRRWRQSILPYPMEPLRASNRTPSASAGPSPEGRRTQDRFLALPVLLEALRLRHRSRRFPGCVVRPRVPRETPIRRTHWSRPPDRYARASAVCATGEDSIELWGYVCLLGGIAEKRPTRGSAAGDRGSSVVRATRFRCGRRTRFMFTCAEQLYPHAPVYDSQASATAKYQSRDKKISDSEYA